MKALLQSHKIFLVYLLSGVLVREWGEERKAQAISERVVDEGVVPTLCKYRYNSICCYRL